MLRNRFLGAILKCLIDFKAQIEFEMFEKI